MRVWLGLFTAASLLAGTGANALGSTDAKGNQGETFELCGLTAKNIVALRKIAETSPGILKLSDFDVYAHFMTEDSGVLVFATKVNSAYPSVACRYYTDLEAKPENLVVDVRCETSQEKCDRFYRMIEGTSLTRGPNNSESNP
ncbi:hypothetical protein [Parasphingorhabdus cellanae]|uniref:Uncharacterized protein n=1 Tax=Parasphingorhabdus cellanae TaxID=2806553 RepID=A0ABX7T8I5_9SPHN|nr:hypothetical protein [Parasphingorhabdus cellanae]QTD57401.1 hypothetical protein J4G78_07705 [Parasphingorhabdus cellanae]